MSNSFAAYCDVTTSPAPPYSYDCKSSCTVCD